VILRTSLRGCKLSCCGEVRISVAVRRGSSAKVIAMAITTSSDAIDSSPSSTSLNGLDGVNFLLVEPTPRRRAARRQPVEATSGRTRRNHRRGQRAHHRTLAEPSGCLCCLGAARDHRRVSWAGNRCDQPRLGRSLSSCRTAWTQSTLRRDWSRRLRRHWDFERRRGVRDSLGVLLTQRESEKRCARWVTT
jgi:hypothetical protein